MRAELPYRRGPGRHGLVLSPIARPYLQIGWLILAVSIAAYLYLSLAVHHQPFHVGARALSFFDLRVYRGAAMRLLEGGSIYNRPIVRHLGFTYPPFAVLVFWPLARLSMSQAKVLVTGFNLVALVFVLRRTFAVRRPHAGGRGLIGSRPAEAWALAAVAAAVALWLEPINVALGYGQVDLLIAALVVFDISRADGAKGKGMAIGLAAAIKLTPLLFIAYLLLSGRRRAALYGTLTFVATIAVSFLLVPSDASRYWGGLVFNSSRVGNAMDAGNQSLTGALGRLLAERQLELWPMAVVVAVALLGLLLAASASRRGDEAAGFSLCAVTTLLASPVSWTHHWTLAVPALLLLIVGAYERRAIWLWACGAMIALLGFSYLPEVMMPFQHPGLTRELHRLLIGMHPSALPMLARDAYVIAGLATLLVAAQLTGLRWLRGSARTPAPLPRPPGPVAVGSADDLDPVWRGVAQDVAGSVQHRADHDGARVAATLEGR